MKNIEITIIELTETVEKLKTKIMAELEGNSKPHGFILFKKTDDRISFDVERLVKKKIEETNADILFCDPMNIDEKGKRFYYNLGPARFDLTFEEDRSPLELYEMFCGKCDFWSTLCGKVVRKSVVLKAMEDAEEIADFKRRIYQCATSITRVKHAFYFSYTEDSLEIENKSYFQSVKTELDKNFDAYEDVKKAITSKEVKLVSFDVFDTLLSRLVLEPMDVFHYLNYPFNKKIGAKNPVPFAEIRRECEVSARQRLKKEHPDYEDVTLDEIYEEMGRITSFSEETMEWIKREEIAFEKKVSIRRMAGYELYELAKECKKKIIFVSDMYLPERVIRELLEQNGYDVSSNLYVSSEYRVCKVTGNLFEMIKQRYCDEDCRPKDVVHIGDSFLADVEGARKVGFCSFYLQSAISAFLGDGNGTYKGNSFFKMFRANGTGLDGGVAFDLFSGVRLMVSTVIHRQFDMPYLSFRRGTDFNSDPYLIGYFCLGMHIVAVADWLYREAKEEGYNKIHFLSRDGYLPLEAYKIWTDGLSDVVPGQYTYMSRNLIPLCDLSSKEDIYNILDKVDVVTATPKKLLKIFAKVLKEDKKEHIEEYVDLHGFFYEKTFGTHANGYAFIKLLSEELIDFDLLKEERNRVGKYLKEVFRPNECFFDMGYNGRVETALASALEYPVDSFYIHFYKELAVDRKRLNGFNMKTFYDYQPVISFLVREQLFSKLDSLFKGVEETPNGEWQLLFEQERRRFEADWVTNMIQQGALAFVRDFKHIVTEGDLKVYWRRRDASIPLEVYLHHSVSADRHIFSPVEFEDLFGGNKKFDLEKYWQKDMDERVGLSISESDALKRLQGEDAIWRLSETRKSFSYKLGLFLTGLPRKFILWRRRAR